MTAQTTQSRCSTTWTTRTDGIWRGSADTPVEQIKQQLSSRPSNTYTDFRNTYQSINDDAKVVNEILAIEEVVGREQEVPG